MPLRARRLKVPFPGLEAFVMRLDLCCRRTNTSERFTTEWNHKQGKDIRTVVPITAKRLSQNLFLNNAACWCHIFFAQSAVGRLNLKVLNSNRDVSVQTSLVRLFQLLPHYPKPDLERAPWQREQTSCQRSNHLLGKFLCPLQCTSKWVRKKQENEKCVLVSVSTPSVKRSLMTANEEVRGVSACE